MTRSRISLRSIRATTSDNDAAAPRLVPFCCFQRRNKLPKTTQLLRNRTPPMNAPVEIVPPYRHTPLFPLGKDKTAYRKLTADGVRVETLMGRDVVVVSHEAMRALAEAAFIDINHLLRPGHLK